MSENKPMYETISPRTQSMIMVGLILAMFSACFDGTVVSTCGPTICDYFNRADMQPWMVTAYMLCETIAIPLGGKLSDIFGRKKLFIIGSVLFFIGSLVAALAPTVEVFIICRGIQGAGGGILIPVATATVADIYPPEKRGIKQGMLGAVYGIGLGIGPLLGGLLDVYIGWQAAFYVNIPIVIAILALTMREFPEQVSAHTSKLDTAGISLLVILLLVVIMFFELVGKSFEWFSLTFFAVLVAVAVIYMLFMHVESRAEDPVLAPHVFKNKAVRQGALFLFILGFSLVSIEMFDSMFTQRILGMTPLESGFMMLSLIFGMIVTSTASGYLVDKTGIRVWLIIGSLCCALGFVMMSEFTPDTTALYYGLCIFVFGLGSGCLMSLVLTAVQNACPPDEVGMTTSAVNLCRNIGSTVGTTIMTMLMAGTINTMMWDGPTRFLAENFPTFNGLGILDFLSNPTFAPFYHDIKLLFTDGLAVAFTVGFLMCLISAVVAYHFKEVHYGEDDSE